MNPSIVNTPSTPGGNKRGRNPSNSSSPSNIASTSSPNASSSLEATTTSASQGKKVRKRSSSPKSNKRSSSPKGRKHSSSPKSKKRQKKKLNGTVSSSPSSSGLVHNISIDHQKQSISFYSNAGKNTVGKKQAQNTQENYKGKQDQMAIYLFNRSIGLFNIDDGEENIPEEYIEHFDPSKSYKNEPHPEKSWTSITTIGLNGSLQEHKVRMALPMKEKYFDELFGYLAVSPQLAGCNRKGRKKKPIIVLPTHQEFADSPQPNAEEDSIVIAAASSQSSLASDDISISSGSTDKSVMKNSTKSQLPVDPENIQTMSASNMQGYKSALAWHMKVIRGVDIKSWEEYQPEQQKSTQSLNDYLDMLVNGYKKTVADKKRRGVMSATEGKSCISNTGFCEIVKGCRRMAQGDNVNLSCFNASIFAVAYVLLQWNLVSRSVSVEDVQLAHVDWVGDCMEIKFAKSKSDQTGEGISNDKHVYANPVNPEVCVITALAIFFLCTPRTCITQRDGKKKLKDSKLFPGTNQKSRWRDILSGSVLDVVDPMALGCAKKDGKLNMFFIFQAIYLIIKLSFVIIYYEISGNSFNKKRCGYLFAFSHRWAFCCDGLLESRVESRECSR